jgi:hypothetical protein
VLQYLAQSPQVLRHFYLKWIDHGRSFFPLVSMTSTGRDEHASVTAVWIDCHLHWIFELGKTMPICMIYGYFDGFYDVARFIRTSKRFAVFHP